MPKAKPSSKKSSRGFPKIFILVIISVLVLVGAGGGYLLFSKTGIITKKIASLPKIKKPSPDMIRARQMTIKADEDSVMQIETKEKIKITLTIPKGSIEKDQVVKMIPYFYNEKSEDPSGGVIISPATIEFKQPVTLMFDLTDSKLRTDAPANRGKMDDVRMNGKSQVLMIDQAASELIPTLVAREVETSTQLRARILNGGGYVFSVNGKDQKRWAENAMAKDNVGVLTVLEASKVLLSLDFNFSKKDIAKANAAVDKILKKDIPPPHEFVAALSVAKLLKNKKTGFIPKAQAAENDFIPAQRTTPKGVIEYVCKLKNLPVEAYVSYGAAAWNYGYGDLRDKCMTAAMNKAADDARKLLADPNAKIKPMLIAIQNLQFLGMEELTDLDQQLMEKVQKTATKEAEKVAYDIDATGVQRAIELQKLQALGAEGPTSKLLEEQLLDEVEKTGKIPDPPPADYTEESDYSEEKILMDQAMSMMGIEILKLMGFTEFDEESLKKKFSEMTDAANQLNEAFLPACLELGGENCEQVYSEAKSGLEKNLQDGYRAAEEVGSVQNSEYEEPEFNEADGGNGGYFEELTPTPEENVENVDEGQQEEDGGVQVETVGEDSQDVNPDQQGSSIESGLESQDAGNTEDSASGTEATSEEEVQGAHTTNPLNVFISSIKKLFSSSSK